MTTAPDHGDVRRRWDRRYASHANPGKPAQLLLEWASRLPRGRALDVACGTGANTLALASIAGGNGPPPIGIDISPVALHIAAAAARERRLIASFFAADVTTYPWPRDHFDLICVFRFLERRLAPTLAAALRPGGYLLYETYTVDQLQFARGPHAPEHLLQRGELRTLFHSLAIVRYVEGIDEREGEPRAVASLVARRA